MTDTPLARDWRALETDDDRVARLTRERELLAAAERDIAEGRVIRDEELDAWLNAWVSGADLPVTAAD